jgi:Isochorismatase family
MSPLIDRRQSQLMIIDVQVKLLPAIANADDVRSGCAFLLRAAQHLGIPTTVSEQYPKGLGGTVAELPIAHATVLEKIEFSCLANPPLRDHLWQHRAAGKQHVVVAGIEAHVCVLQTVLDLVGEGADVFVVADAVGSRSAQSRDLALTRMARAGAQIVDREMVLFEWLERAGTPEFKALQALVK